MFRVADTRARTPVSPGRTDHLLVGELARGGADAPPSGPGRGFGAAAPEAKNIEYIALLRNSSHTFQRSIFGRLD